MGATSCKVLWRIRHKAELAARADHDMRPRKVLNGFSGRIAQLALYGLTLVAVSGNLLLIPITVLARRNADTFFAAVSGPKR
jgi:hypothetical protein